MPDYDAWDLTNDFTVAQASCLWCEVDQGISFTYQKSKNPRIAAIEQMLVSEIRAGRLRADSTQNALSSIGDYSRSLVSREALKELADRKGLTPKFLFTSARQPSSEVHAGAEMEAARDPHSSGFPGRPPKAKHLIEQEFQRRRDAGEVCSTLTAEACALLEWLKGEHPSAPPPTIKTIKNNLRDQYREYEQKQCSK